MENIETITESTSARLNVLNDKLEQVKKAFKEGKISEEEFTKQSDKLNQSIANLNNGLKENQQELDKAAKKQEEINKKQQESVDNANEYSSSMEKIGATANTAFGILAAGIRETNPGLSTALGSVQKLIPNLTELGNAAKKTGSWIKAIGSGAGLLTLITLVTTLITDFDNLASTIGLSETAIKKVKDTFNTVITWISGKVGSIVGTIRGSFQVVANTFKKLLKGDIKGALSEFGKGTVKDAIETGKQSGESFAENLVTAKSRKKAQAAAEEYAKKFNETFKKSIDYLYSQLDDIISSLNDELPSLDPFKVDPQESANLKTLSEWFQRNLSDVDKQIAAINVKKDQYIKAGVSEVEATKWAEEEKEKIRQSAADKDKKREEEIQSVRLDNLLTFTDAISTSYKTISSAISSSLDAELEAGKISESEYKRRKKALDAFNIAAIVSDTASGIVKVWKAFSAEKIANAETALATGPAAAATLASLNAKSLASAIAQTATLTATGAAGIASIHSGSLGSTNTPKNTTQASASVTSTTPQQTYVLNNDYNDILNTINKSISTTKVVLPIDNLEKVQSNAKIVKSTSSF